MTTEPATLTVPQAAAVLGIGQRTAYELIARQGFPVPVLAIGRSKKISRRALMAYIDGDLAPTTDQPPPLEWRGSAS